MRVFRCFCFPADLSAYTTTRGALGMDLQFVLFRTCCRWSLFKKGSTADSTVQPFCVVDFFEELLRTFKDIVVMGFCYFDGEF